jgi:hypothetical protein
VRVYRCDTRAQTFIYVTFLPLKEATFFGCVLVCVHQRCCSISTCQDCAAPHGTIIEASVVPAFGCCCVLEGACRSADPAMSAALVAVFTVVSLQALPAAGANPRRGVCGISQAEGKAGYTLFDAVLPPATGCILQVRTALDVPQHSCVQPS